MSRDHDADRELSDTAGRARDAIVRGLREVAERIERAPLDRLHDSLPWLATSSEMLAREVERALGGA